MFRSGLAPVDLRRVDRDEVQHRARAIRADGRPVRLLIVNVSSEGLMARCDEAVTTDEALTLTLPAVGAVLATVRWALGGRMGAQFERAIPATDYQAMLAALQPDRSSPTAASRSNR